MKPRPRRCFAALGFTFLFAPYYHAATKSIAPVRAALGVRTVFNILGPLSNPAAPPFLVIGAFDARDGASSWRRRCAARGVKRAFVIHGAEGWDEPTPVGAFTLFDVGAQGVQREQRTPADYGLRAVRRRRSGGRRCGPQCARTAAGAERRAARGQAMHIATRCCSGAALALEVSGRESSPRRGAGSRRAGHRQRWRARTAGAAGTLRCG